MPGADCQYVGELMECSLQWLRVSLLSMSSVVIIGFLSEWSNFDDDGYWLGFDKVFLILYIDIIKNTVSIIVYHNSIAYIYNTCNIYYEILWK